MLQKNNEITQSMTDGNAGVGSGKTGRSKTSGPQTKIKSELDGITRGNNSGGMGMNQQQPTSAQAAVSDAPYFNHAVNSSGGTSQPVYGYGGAAAGHAVPSARVHWGVLHGSKETADPALLGKEEQTRVDQKS